MANVESTTDLREADNFVVVEGFLSQKNLEKTVDRNGKNIIKGNLVIEVAEGEEHKVSYYASETTSKGNPSKGYYALLDLYENGISKAQVLSGMTVNSMEQVTKIHIIGKIVSNDYYKKEAGKVVSYPIIRANSVRKSGDNFKPQAFFSVEAYCETIEWEKDKEGKETGRLIVGAYIPLYGGDIAPVTFIAEDDKAQFIAENYTTGKTCKIYGKFVHKIETVVNTISGFGTPQERVFTNTRNEIVIEGGEKEQYAVTDAKNYNKELIKNAVMARQEKLERIEKQGKEKEGNGYISNTSASSFGSQNTNTANDMSSAIAAFDANMKAVNDTTNTIKMVDASGTVTDVEEMPW